MKPYYGKKGFYKDGRERIVIFMEGKEEHNILQKALPKPEKLWLFLEGLKNDGKIMEDLDKVSNEIENINQIPDWIKEDIERTGQKKCVKCNTWGAREGSLYCWACKKEDSK